MPYENNADAFPTTASEATALAESRLRISERRSQVVEARYPTRCSDCGGHVYEGDRIVRDEERDGRQWRHERCPDSASIFDIKPTETVCLDCFTVKPCACDDGL